MGYTHSWEISIRPTNEQWSNIKKAVEKLFATPEAEYTIQYGRFRFTAPVIDQEVVHFNGKADEAGDVFYFDRWKGGDYCKTSRQPYDRYVVACLVIAKHFASSRVNVRTDGDLEDWEDGIELAESVLKEKFSGYIKHD